MRGIRQAARAGRAMVNSVRRPPWVPPGHYYSPHPSTADIERALSWPDEAPGVELHEEDQLRLWGDLAPMFADLRRDRYTDGPANRMFGAADASVLNAMLRRLRPRRILEVGSGYSTAVMLDTAEAYALDLRVRCVEPYPERLLSLLRDGDEVELARSRAQDVPIASYSSLAGGDVLFVDSTHVAKAGSDVLWLVLHVFPRLAPGLIVHVHDVFWPFEYPEAWLREGRDWTEDYLLHAFLARNDRWRILLFSNWLWKRHPELVPDHLSAENPGSIWLRAG